MPRGYGQYCPVAIASEILGERWTILVIMALTDGVTRFNDMQRALPRISATMLSQRLQTLEAAGIVHRSRARNGAGTEYRLTAAGTEMTPIIMAIGAWGQRWGRDLEPDDLDPLHLAWSMHLRMNTAAMPPGRTVIEFEFTGTPSDVRRFWILATDGVVEACVKHPGFEPDLRVLADIRRFVESWRGFRCLRSEIAAGKIRLKGPRALKDAFPDWLLLSMLADTPRRRPGRERLLYERTQKEASTPS